MAYDFLLASPEPSSEDQEVRMWRFVSAPAVIVLTLSLLAQTSPLAGKPEGHALSSCIVGGRVVTVAEGSPLKLARVSLVPDHSEFKKQIYATTSDTDGHFLLKDVVPGRYQFFATRAGFVNQQYQAKSSSKFPESGFGKAGTGNETHIRQVENVIPVIT